jgi:hypothetical protein
MEISDIWELREEYQDVEYTNFRANLNSLRKKLTKQGNEADESGKAVAKDRDLYPVKTNPPGSTNPRWNGS